MFLLKKNNGLNLDFFAASNVVLVRLRHLSYSHLDSPAQRHHACPRRRLSPALRDCMLANSVIFSLCISYMHCFFVTCSQPANGLTILLHYRKADDREKEGGGNIDSNVFSMHERGGYVALRYP